MCSKSIFVSVMLAGACSLSAQNISQKIDLGGKDSPVGFISSTFQPSNATARGGAYVVDIHESLSLRNSSQKKIRSVTLAVLAQEVDDWVAAKK